MNFSATTKNNVLIENTYIQADGFSSVFFKNTGTDTAYINDNIELLAGSTFSFDNLPYVKIDETISIRFAGVSIDKKVLVIKTYFKEGK